MKKKCFYLSQKNIPHDVLVNDLQESLSEIIGEGWRILPFPLVLDDPYFDILLVHLDGTVAVGKVMDETAGDGGEVGALICAYEKWVVRHEQIKKLYQFCTIDCKKNICVKLFVSQKLHTLEEILTRVSIPCEVFMYQIITDGEHDHLAILREKGETPETIRIDTPQVVEDADKKKGSRYSSFIRIIGENVRSDASSHNIQRVIETNFIERGALTEEELITFFDFEKKIDEYRHNSYN